MKMSRRSLMRGAAGASLGAGTLFERIAREEIGAGIDGASPHERSLAQYPDTMEAFIRETLGSLMWSKQLEIVRSVEHNPRTAVRSAHAVGKGLALDTPLPTPDGWTTMGEVQPGDQLLDESGRPCTVLAISEVNELPCYRVTFSDGTSLVADIDHQWSVLRYKPRAQGRRRQGVTDFRQMWDSAETVTTPELAAILDHLGQRDASIPLAMPLQLHKSSVGNLPPYILGVWLGDGIGREAAVTVGDFEIVERIRSYGWTAEARRSTLAKTAPTYRIAPPGRHGRSVLNEWGLTKAKHIPAAFLRGSEEQRRELLAGLLDTDGFAMKGRGAVGIDLCDERLANDVAELVRSLGYWVNVKRGTVYFEGRPIDRWRLAFQVDRPVFGLERKNAALRLNGSQAIRATHRMVMSVEPVETVPTKCVSVDSPRSLYLAGEAMIPTHNSWIAARVALAFLHTRPNSVVITTAPSYGQVRNVLWRYIRGVAESPNQPLLGKSLMLEYQIGPNWYGMGFKGDDRNQHVMQGFHAEDLLLIVDEAAGVHDLVLQASEAILTGRGARSLLIGNPTSMTGGFRDAFHKDQHLYNTITVSAYDTPNFTMFGITREDMLTGAWEQKIKGYDLPYPGLVDPFWVNRQIQMYGEDSPYVRTRVDAEFAQDNENTLIPLSNIEKAEENKTRPDRKAPVVVGIDVARTGYDETALCVRQGITELHFAAWRGLDLMSSVGRVRRELEAYGGTDISEVRVDVIGLGAGLADRLRELGYNVVDVNVSRRSSDPVKWANFRHEAWWQMRELYEAEMIVPAYGHEFDEAMKAQLSDVRFFYSGSSTTMPQIESKEATKRRTGRSPDRAEAQLLAYCTLPREHLKETPTALVLGKAKDRVAGKIQPRW